MTWISRSFGSSFKRARNWPIGMLIAPGTRSTTSSTGCAHVEQEGAVEGVPMRDGHVAAKDVGAPPFRRS